MIYLVQIGKGKKGAYRTRYTFANLETAYFWYRSLNIGLGFKKRIIVKETRQLFAREWS